MRRGRKATRARFGLRLPAFAAALAVLAALPASAHRLGESYLYLQIYETKLTGRFEVSFSDLNGGLELPGTADQISIENLDEHIDFLKHYYQERVRLEHRGRPLTIEFREHSVLGEEHGFVQLPFDIGGLDGVPDRLTFDYSVLIDEDPRHRGFLLVEHNWATGTFANENQTSLIFGPGSQRQEFEITSSGRLRGFLSVTGLGIEHIRLGIDHIMFLIALLLPTVLRRQDGASQAVDSFIPAFWYMVKIVTAFTVAHSLTLTAAALGWVRLPERLVETAIAVSVAIAAAELLVPILKGRIRWVVVGFGLVHGFAFAGALSKMGLFVEHLGLSILAFNLGIWLGQLGLVAILLPLLFVVRRWSFYRRAVLPAAAISMILVAGVWTFERALDVDVPMRELLPPSVQKVIP